MSAPATDDKMAPRRPSAERTATAATETHSVYATPGATTTLGANTTPGAVVANTADHITPAQANQQHTNAPVYNDEKASLSSRRDSDPKAAPQYMDAEKGSSDTVPADQHQPEESPSKVKLFYRRHRTVIRLVIEALVFVFFTVYVYFIGFAQCSAPSSRRCMQRGKTMRFCLMPSRYSLHVTDGSSTASLPTMAFAAPTTMAGSSPCCSTSPSFSASSSTTHRLRSS